MGAFVVGHLFKTLTSTCGLSPNLMGKWCIMLFQTVALSHEMQEARL